MEFSRATTRRGSLKGYLLIDALLAAILFAVAVAGLSSSFFETVKAEARIRESYKTYDGLRIFYMRLDQDLRNAVALKDFPFKGAKDAIEFPVARQKLYLVRYYMKDDSLYRSQKEILTSLKAQHLKPEERVILKTAKGLEYLFPYEDDDSRKDFQAFWLAEPYYGIPRSVLVRLQGLEKIVSIPQGRVGHINHE